MTKTYIKELDIISFGKFEDKKIILDEKFNLIYGRNESGKSTIADFIEGVLYGFDEGKKRRSFSYKKEKYKPSLSYRYAGNILFSHDGHDILVERNFETGDYRIFNKDTNEEIKGQKSDLNFPGKYLFGISYLAFQNLIKNYQSQRMNDDGKKILIEIFMDSSFDMEFSANKAIQYLERNLEDLGSERAYTKPYYIIKKKIDDLEKENKNLENLRNNYSKDLKTLYDQRLILDNNRVKLETLKEKRDNFRAKLAGENYRQAQKTKEALDLIVNQLNNYIVYEKVDEDYFERIDKLIEKNESVKKDSSNFSNNILFLIIALIIIFTAYYFKNLFFLGLLIVIYPLYIFTNKSYKNDYDKDLKNELSRYSLGDINSYRIFKDKYYKYLSLKTEKEKLQDILEVLDRQEKRDSYGDIDSNINIVDLDRDIKILEESYASLSLENINLEKKLSAVEEKLKDELGIKDDLSYYKDKLIEIEEEKEANRLAISLIEESQKDSKDQINFLNNKINDIIKQISKGLYKEISYNKDLSPVIVKNDGTRLDIKQVSTGFFDQLNFALKFALREKISKNKYIIFDDTFINYDENRLTDALYYLLDLSDNNQIIYFTCHKRESEIFDREGILVNKIILE